MARVGIVFGLLLCGLSAFGMFGSVEKIPMQFVPMMFGIPMLFCGVVALNPHRRRSAMRAEITLAALGAGSGIITASVRGWHLANGDPINPLAWGLVIAMTIICSLFLIFTTVLFFQERKRKANFVRMPPSSATFVVPKPAEPVDQLETTSTHDRS